MNKIEYLIQQSNQIEEVWDTVEDTQSMLAWYNLIYNFKKISVPAILMTHETIMVRTNPRIAGQWRTCNVEVGGYAAPYWLVVPPLMDDWVNWNQMEDPRQAHIRFEKIHPFEDGNGRTGRMLMWFQEYLNGTPFTEITYLERDAYYDWFAD